jgi:hypothetical protein
MEALAGLSLIASVLLIVVAILWIILPFIVMASNSRLDSIIDLLRNTNTQLITIAQLLKHDNRLLNVEEEDINPTLVKESLSPEAIRIYNFISRKGDYSKDHIVDELKIPAKTVDSECVKLYQAGKLLRGQCERIIMRRLKKEELNQIAQ